MKTRYNLYIFFNLFLYSHIQAIAQTNIIRIEDVIDIVLRKSNRVEIIDNNLRKTEIDVKIYNVSLLPKVTASISLPYQRSISEIIQPDGGSMFLERNYINSNLNLTVSQVLPFTGGTINMNSSINNARDFNNNTSNFSSNWVSFSYSQSINGYNPYKWSKILNLLNEKKNTIINSKEKLKLKYEVSEVYINTQLLQLKADLLQENIKKSKTILTNLEDKFKFGRVLKTDIEQAKIMLEQFQQQFEINKIEYNLGIQSINNYTNSLIKIDSLIAVEQEDFIIDKNDLIEAIKKNEYKIDKEIDLLESDMNSEKIKKEGAVLINLQLGMGLNSSSSDFPNLFDNPSQTQYFTINSKIPLLDWNKSNMNYKISKLDRENIELFFKDEENKIYLRVEEIIKYKTILSFQKQSLEKQLKIYEDLVSMYDELLSYDRITIIDYKTLMIEYYNIKVEYQKIINNLYLLKLKINEFYLVF